MVRTTEVMGELLGTILTVEKFVVAGALIVGLATLGLAALVFLLSLRLRRRERQTLFKIGGSRPAVALVMGSEVLFVLLGGLLLAGGLTLLTHEFGSLAIRFLIRM
jgi:putative ABC transport system permease protein